MNLDDLRLFCHVIETRSFTRAAGRAFVTQSAVSQRIRALEKDLRRPLLDRAKGRGGVFPTEAGTMLYERSQSILRQVDDLETAIRDLDNAVTGNVRVAAVYSVGLHTIPARLKAFLTHHAGIKVHLEYNRTGRIYEAVLEGHVDIGIVACPESRPGIDVQPFALEEMVMVVAPEHRLSGHAEVALSEMEGEDFITFSDDIPTRHLVDTQLRGAGVTVHIVAAYDNIETIKHLVEIGSGISILPMDTVLTQLGSGQLRPIRLREHDRFYRPAGMILRRGIQQREAVGLFMEAMRPPA